MYKRQVQQRRKMIVFPLMFLAFAGCMYLIFAPAEKEDVNVESEMCIRDSSGSTHGTARTG